MSAERFELAEEGPRLAAGLIVVADAQLTELVPDEAGEILAGHRFRGDLELALSAFSNVITSVV